MLLSRWWLLLTAPACIIGLGLAVASVMVLLRTIRVPEFARLPLAAEQDMAVPDSGPLAFVIDRPRFQNIQASPLRPFALAVSLVDIEGHATTADMALAPVSVQGVGRTRTEIASLPSIRPGRYRVRIEGLVAEACADCFVIVARPVSKLRMVAAILGIIAAGALAIGGLIGSLATLVKFQTG